MYNEKIAQLERKFLFFYSLTILIIFSVWGIFNLMGKNYTLFALDLGMTILSLVFLILPYSLKRKNIILTFVIFISTTISYIFIFYYRFDSAVIYSIPMLLGIFFIYNYEKRTERLIIMSLIIYIVLITTIYYLTYNMWPKARAPYSSKYIADIYDNFFCFLLTAGTLYFLIKKGVLQQNQREFLNAIIRENNSDDRCFNHLKEILETNPGSYYTVFEDCYPIFVRKILDLAPNLIMEELKIIGLLKLSYSTKQIAKITNSTTRAIEGKKHRIRKKLDLPSDIDISLYLNNL